MLAFQAVTASKNLEKEAEIAAARVGYEEDILPLFQRSCGACHNGVAKTAGLVVTDYEQLLLEWRNDGAE